MSIFLFLFENRGVYEIIWKKYFRAGGATDDDIAPAHCMLDIVCYKHTLRICITFFFPLQQLVARTRLDVTS